VLVNDPLVSDALSINARDDSVLRGTTDLRLLSPEDATAARSAAQTPN
jgi:hypothetical protein